MESNRQVSYETGEKLAKQWNVPFMETSAKSKHNNIDCFCQIIREIKKKEAEIRLATQEKKEEPSKCCCIIL